MLFSLESLSVSALQVLTLGIVSSSCSLIGLFLFYRRATMMANAISHTVLLAIVATCLIQQGVFTLFFKRPVIASVQLDTLPAFSLEWILIASVMMAYLTYFTVQILSSRFKVPIEASIGLALSAYFSLGILLITLFGRNSHIGIETIMGNIDAVSAHDVFWMLVVFIITLSTLSLCFKELITSSFDPLFAQSVGISTEKIELVLMMLTGAIVITSFKAIGYILVLAFLVGIPLCARLFLGKRATMTSMVILSLGLSWGFSAIAVLLAQLIFLCCDFSLSTGGLAVSLILLCSCLCFFPAKRLSLLSQE